ncbi:glycosyltransferase family 2 protein [Caulobacter henricii]|uniref:Glycosyl transferase family 2 n=1 Tax=Caulobacter henricii TaxID=69395 RepID=A0A0P0P3Q1_9CAUL|nr:glycosyltransferase family 2 protein [Caulobacter henricii]ALL14944.1 glycosyl transferase family 2 [Caulobacter henricii]
MAAKSSIVRRPDHGPSPVRIAAILPCYRSGAHVLEVIAAIGPEVEAIICVDDACPDGVGDLIEAKATDPRVVVLRHAVNQGVGGAVCTGYAHALAMGADVFVKIDSDGQMDPSEIAVLVDPIARGDADYAKGNRFYNIEDLQGMPALRLFGNAGLSFLTKLSTGYWSVFDPTNGYTAVHARMIERVRLDKVAKRYFFESDLLFRLGTLRARVADVPMAAIYGDEVSQMNVGKIVLPFLASNIANFFKRLFYTYLLRNFSVASLYLLIGVPLTLFGLVFGAGRWIEAVSDARPATSGQVMFAALPILIGVQMVLNFIAYDVENEPRTTVWPLLRPKKRGA